MFSSWLVLGKDGNGKEQEQVEKERRHNREGKTESDERGAREPGIERDVQTLFLLQYQFLYTEYRGESVASGAAAISFAVVVGSAAGRCAAISSADEEIAANPVPDGPAPP